MLKYLSCKYLFFDFDGTLCDTDRDIREGWHRTFQRLNLHCPDFDRLFRVGPALHETAARFFPEYDAAMKQTIVRTFKECYDNAPDFPNTHPYPWVREWLTVLRRRGAKMFVVTNKREKPTLFLLKQNHLEEFFEGVFAPDSFPEPDLGKVLVLGKVLKKFQIEPDCGVMIGDMPGDVKAGQGNQLHTAGVLWGYGSREQLLESGADELISQSDAESLQA